MRSVRHGTAAVRGDDVRPSVARLRTMLSEGRPEGAIVVTRDVDRSADQVRRIFRHALGDWVDVEPWCGVGKTGAAGKVHGLVRFGRPWTETDGSLCRHFRLCSDPTTVVDSIRCLTHPRLGGQVRVTTEREGPQRLTVTARGHEPASRIGRLLADPSTVDPTAATWVRCLTEVIAARLERGSAAPEDSRDVMDVMRLPLPGVVEPAALA